MLNNYNQERVLADISKEIKRLAAPFKDPNWEKDKEKRLRQFLYDEMLRRDYYLRAKSEAQPTPQPHKRAELIKQISHIVNEKKVGMVASLENMQSFSIVKASN